MIGSVRAMSNTMDAKHMLRCAFIASATIVLVTAGMANAAPKTQDWTGIWARVGSFAFDPTVLPEHRENPPYRPEWQARYEEALAAAERGQFTADPTAGCLPPGMPRLMNMVYPMEIIQKPKQMTIIAEWDSQVRRIHLDGRPHPKDPDPSFNGHSIGHWEGKTLVVDTIGLRGDTVFDQSGVRHSDQLHLIERFTLVSPDRLELLITADDPVAFYQPWAVKKTYKRAPSEEIMEYVCEDNNRNPVGSDGKVTTILRGAGQ
jgi:hypothetical protein